MFFISFDLILFCFINLIFVFKDLRYYLLLFLLVYWFLKGTKNDRKKSTTRITPVRENGQLTTVLKNRTLWSLHQHEALE
jgi:hypothetical protein